MSVHSVHSAFRFLCFSLSRTVRAALCVVWGSDAGAFVWFVVLPNDSEKEQYTIRKHFKKYVGNVQKSPAKYFSVTPKLRPKHVQSMAQTHTATHSVQCYESHVVYGAQWVPFGS